MEGPVNSPAHSEINIKSLCIAAAIMLGPYLVFTNLDVPLALPLSLFISAVVLWLTEIIPLFITSLLIPFVGWLTGLIGPHDALLSFGNDTILLFLGVFILTAAMHKHGLDRRLALSLLSRFPTLNTPERIVAGLSLMTWTMSLLISNTAACAIAVSISLGLLSVIKDSISDEAEYAKLEIRLLISCAFAASIGGIGTPVGSPPNVIALELLSQKGIDISFLSWCVVGIPFAFVLWILLMATMRLLIPLARSDLTPALRFFKEACTALPPPSRSERVILVVFLITLAGWILPDFLAGYVDKTILKQWFSMGNVSAALALVTFFVRGEGDTRVMQPRDLRHVDWATLLLFSGGICLGRILETSGLSHAIGTLLSSGDLSPPWVFILVITATSILLSEFASNTAAATILVPIVLGATSEFSQGLTLSMIAAVVLGCSFGFMLPISTPPNAIIYGTGKVPAAKLRNTGVVFDIAGLVVVVGFCTLLAMILR